MAAQLRQESRTEIEIEDAECHFADQRWKNAPPPTYPRADSIKFALHRNREVQCLRTEQRLVQAERAGKQAVIDAAAREVAAKREAQQKRADEKQARWDRERQQKIAHECPKGLGDFGELLFAIPYDVKGRCYEFVGKTLQVLDRSIGLYQLGRDKNVYIDFGPNAAPSQFFQGYVKGVGVFSYTTVVGAKMIVPSLAATALPPEEFPASAAD